MLFVKSSTSMFEVCLSALVCQMLLVIYLQFTCAEHDTFNYSIIVQLNVVQVFQGHKMAFEAEIHFCQAPISFKYIEFGFDKVKVH